MMFNNKLVACIKVDGKILREFKDSVYIPFGAEYSVLIKNLSTVRAVVHISVDGTNAAPGGLVVNANSEVELERFIKDGNMESGNRFKFIERTAAIEDGPRGIKVEDGLVRINFQFEKVLAQTKVVTDHIWHNEVHHYPSHPYPPYRWPQTTTVYGGIGGSSVGAVGAVGAGGNGIMRSASVAPPQMTFGATSATAAVAAPSQPLHTQGHGPATKGIAPRSLNDAGITVPGSKSDQKFKPAEYFPLDIESHVMILKLLGETVNNGSVSKPITVKAKPKCQTCGKVNKAINKFCSECGTALEII
jgi:hypothetical protein